MTKIMDLVFEAIEDHQMAGNLLENYEDLAKRLREIAQLFGDPENQPDQFSKPVNRS